LSLTARDRCSSPLFGDLTDHVHHEFLSTGGM
jgi:hypothetical protein